MEAAGTYETLASLRSDQAEIYFAAAVAFEKAGKPSAVERMLDAGRVALSRHEKKDHPWFIATMGTYTNEANAYRDAIDLFESALSRTDERTSHPWRP